MTDVNRIKFLRFALLLVGLAFLVGLYPLTIFWPSGWAWHTGRSEYLQMILAIYATLGVFLIWASRDPLAHRSLIWFTVWSSVVHGAVMAVQAIANTQHIGHLWGDVAALFVIAGLLAFLTPTHRCDGDAARGLIRRCSRAQCVDEPSEERDLAFRQLERRLIEAKPACPVDFTE